MSHNVFSHTLLAAVLFVVSMLVFDGFGLYSTLLFTTAEVSGTLLSSGTDYAQDAERLSGLLPVILAVILNIVIYYLLAAVIIFFFGLFRKKK